MEWVKLAFNNLGYNSYKEEQPWIHNFVMMHKWEDEDGKPVSWILSQCVVMVQDLDKILVNENRELLTK